ncbi:glycosyl transferase, partial [Fervidobacterium sp. SC_NGM5_G05]
MVMTGFLLIILFEVILVYIFSFFSNKTSLLLEYPSERKKHNKPVPLIGGVILFLMVLFLSKLGIYENNIIRDVVFYIVFAIGIIDDLFEIPYYLKLLLQFIA